MFQAEHISIPGLKKQLPVNWLLFAFLLIFFNLSSYAQTINQVPLRKPQNYKDKILRSEKSELVNFTVPRKLYHGMVSHYNYYYNAETKINAIVQRAQLSHKDDFTKLLPFYDFSLSSTAADSVELDSVLIKATAGIVLHDLRNSYIDDLFLLIGKSYYYWDKPDSAFHLFQYINYNFYPHKKDDYRIVIGSTADAKNGQVSVGSQEKKGIIRKTFSKPPARNDALFWMAKIYAEQDMHDEAVSLVSLLKKDPLYPKRLHPRLDEILAYSFYNRQLWDSAAFYLKKSLKIEKNPSRLARKEFLLAQLYTLSDQPANASVYYDKAKKHTSDPVMHIHARLNNALLGNKSLSNDDESLNELLKLTRKERFDGYEDLLFFAAADVALQKKDTASALTYLQKSTRFARDNPESVTRNKAFLKLGQLALHQKNYRLAAACYDSLNLQDPQLSGDLTIIEKTKTTLVQLVKYQDIVIREDSLRLIAAMPEEQRESYLKNLLKRLRKERGIKEEVSNSTSGSVIPSNNTIPDLFATGNNTGWYFNVNNQKNKGSADFKNKWGNRPNMDNWRRQAAIDASILMSNQGFPGNPGGDGDVDNPISINTGGGVGTQNEDELSIESLIYNLPLSEEKILLSDQRIFEALVSQGNILKNQLEDYEGAAAIYKDLLNRFPGKDSALTITNDLYYCLLKTGKAEEAEFYKNTLASQKEQNINISPEKQDLKTEEIAKASYEQIYSWYIEGDFDKARKNKIHADSIYGATYWTPQLMYIEAVYFGHNKQDSLALDLLNQILTRFGNNPIAEKATILQDVLRRRNEIEQHLRESKIVRLEDPAIIIRTPEEKSPKTENADHSRISDKRPSADSTSENKTQNNLSANKTPDSTKNNSGNQVIIQPNQGKTPNNSDTANNAGNQVIIQTNQGKAPNNSDTANNAGNKPVVVQPVKNASDSCILAIALINVYPVYKNECQAAMVNYYKNNTLAGIKGVIPVLKDGKGNFGLIIFDQIRTAAECETAFKELTSITPGQLYFLPLEKYKIIRVPASAISEIESIPNVDEFIKVVNQWIKD